MCIYRGTELFMTTYWPNTFEKKIFVKTSLIVFALQKETQTY